MSEEDSDDARADQSRTSIHAWARRGRPTSACRASLARRLSRPADHAAGGFFAFMASGYLALQRLFAWLYLLDPGGISDARPGDFQDAFFFSVQTLGTSATG